MAAGEQATQYGWRSSYQTMGIFNAILLIVFLFLYEETKYVPAFIGQVGATLEEDDPAIEIREDGLVKFN